MDESKLHAKLSLKICIRKSCFALNSYSKTAKKKMTSPERYKAKSRLRNYGFSFDEINEIFHPELTKTNRY